MRKELKKVGWWSVLLAFALASTVLLTGVVAEGQDQQDDPPTRVARLGYMEGSVSFQPAGETDWVGAVPNRPMTTGDQLWSDQGSRAELQLGSAVIRLSANTGISFLNLDNSTVQLQLSSGVINLRVRRLNPNDVFEIDTPNLAFSLYQPGSYRVEASSDGTYTVVTIRAGDGEATGNGQTYSVHAGQSATFSGTDQLNADVEQIGDPDQFDNWADGRDHRYDNSRSAQYLSRDVVGFEDLDENGNWHDDPSYGHVWFPNQASPGWAPYHQGHWAWIDPWGYTWVDDSSWGYAPFHYGRWVSVGGQWGWIAGPPAQPPVYAPALVVFIGGGGGFGGNIGWFPLGPREVFVPTYPVSAGYMTQVNVSNTTVSTTTVTNVYNTTVINNRTTNVTNITNVTYANKNVQGAVTVVPQNAFASAQPVAKAAVKVTPQQIAAAPVSARVAVAPTPQAVMGGKASTAGHVAAPPAAIRNRQVVAKATPPPPPIPFAKRQQAMAAHPGVPLAKHEVATLRPANTASSRPMVKQAPPGKPATPTTGHPGNQPPNKAATPPPPRPGTPPAANNRPATTPPPQPNNRPEAKPSQPAPANHPEAAKPAEPPKPSNRPSPPPNKPEANKPAPKAAEPAPKPSEPARPATPPPHAAPPPQAAHPEQNKPAPHTEPARPQAPPSAAHPEARPEPKPAAKPETPEEKKKREEQERK